jgi:hypothetical protein
LFACLFEIAKQIAAIAVVNKRSRRHGDDQFRSAAPVTVIRPAPPTALSAPMFAIHNLCQAVGASDGPDDDIAAIAAIAAVRPALGHVFLAPKTATTGPAVAALHKHCHTIDKHDKPLWKTLSGNNPFSV